MRFRSARSVDGYTVYAVAGVHSVSFAIDSKDALTGGLLGFCVERLDLTEDERYFMFNTKVFKELVPNPKPNQSQSSFDHPIQSFVWDDFSVKPAHEYEYFFYPAKGKPKNLSRSNNPVSIRIKTEPECDPACEHDIFFNRGAASSQAYVRKFHNQRPDKIKDPNLQAEALTWLGRGLDEAIIRFIQQAQKGDALYGCFYEFHYGPVVDAFAAAIRRKVDVHIIYDAKQNAESFPRKENKAAMRNKIADRYTIPREANKSDIQHNKFIVYVHGGQAVAVWTGSTNISEGGIFGQTNVGHWIRNRGVAEQYLKYWKLLEDDPGNRSDRSTTEGRTSNKEYKQDVVGIQHDITATKPAGVPQGMTCIFSPRTTADMLTTYASLLDNVNSVGCVTLAFGINKTFKLLLQDNVARNPITFMLLEKEDKPTKKNAAQFVRLGPWNNVYAAFGAYIDEPVYQFAREVNTRSLKLNTHVIYVHTKFMLLDPLSDKPVVITGSANFSEPSTTANDENMVIIKGERRVADIYFTEFMRLFSHYYFRSVFEILEREAKAKGKKVDTSESVFLKADDSWLANYAPGKLKRKRVEMIAGMSGAVAL